MTIWYPSQQSLNDLTVTEIESGFEFSAPNNTECAKWLGYYNSTNELREEFNAAIVGAITDRIKELENGGTQQNTDRDL